MVGGRDIAEHAIDRAKKAGFNALVVTIDTPVAGLRERDPRNGMKELLGGSLLSKLPYVSQFFARPSWFASFLLDGGTPPLASGKTKKRRGIFDHDSAMRCITASVT